MINHFLHHTPGMNLSLRLSKFGIGMSLVFLVMSFGVMPLCAAEVYAPEDVPNVQLKDSRRYVSDPENLVPSTSLIAADRTLEQIRRKTTVEGVAIVVPSIGNLTPTEFCENIFTSWGIGKSDKDNGFILLIATQDRSAWIQTGYGLEGVLTDADCSALLRKYMVPHMKKGDIGNALNSTLFAISDVLENPVAMEELRSSQADRRGGAVSTLSPDVLWDFVRLVAFLIFLGTLALFLFTLRKAKGKNQYEKAKLWRQAFLLLLWGCVFSLGAGIVFAIPAFLLYRRNRDGVHKCGNCGAKMKKLSEEEDNSMLSPSQNLEEQLNTVDYDVWVCPDCGTVDRFAFKKNQNKYTKCPRCGTIARSLTEDHTIIPATSLRAGEGQRTYTCRYCGDTHRERYKIPRKPDDAAVAAGIFGAAIGSGRGRGGGGFGGGFGGGRTGGGGGGASW